MAIFNSYFDITRPGISHDLHIFFLPIDDGQIPHFQQTPSILLVVSLPSGYVKIAIENGDL